jgi:hypothetical protein
VHTPAVRPSNIFILRLNRKYRCLCHFEDALQNSKPPSGGSDSQLRKIGCWKSSAHPANTDLSRPLQNMWAAPGSPHSKKYILLPSDRQTFSACASAESTVPCAVLKMLCKTVSRLQAAPTRKLAKELVAGKSHDCHPCAAQRQN